jgi:hypothetical protein
MISLVTDEKTQTEGIDRYLKKSRSNHAQYFEISMYRVILSFFVRKAKEGGREVAC